MSLAPKEVACECGNVMTLDVSQASCVKCGKPLYYDKIDRRRQKQQVSFPPKEVECVCGNVMTVDIFRVWCRKCGKPVYHDPKNQKRHKLNGIYMALLFIGTITFLVYVYIELIARYTF